MDKYKIPGYDYVDFSSEKFERAYLGISGAGLRKNILIILAILLVKYNFWILNNNFWICAIMITNSNLKVKKNEWIY